MKIPKKIKVGCITYTIRYDKLEDCYGIHDSNAQEIILANGMSPEMTRNTFLHELMHAIMCQIGAEDAQKNEILIQCLANEIDKLFELKPDK